MLCKMERTQKKGRVDLNIQQHRHYNNLIERNNGRSGRCRNLNLVMPVALNYIQDGRCWVDDVWDAEEQLCFKYRMLRNFV